MKKRNIKEIETRILNLKGNINLIKNEKAKENLEEEIKVLSEFKDKSESQILSAITDDRNNKQEVLRWMVGLLI